MADKDLRFTISATDDASDVLEDVATDAEQLEKLTPTVKVDADTSEASGDLEQLEAKVEAFPTLKVRVDEEAIGRARKKVESVADSGDLGSRFGEQFASDLGSQLNEDVAGIGAGLTAAMESGLAGFGVSSTFAPMLVAALGLGTVVVAAVAKFWETFQGNAEASKKVMEDALSIQQSLAQGQLTEAAEKVGAGLAPQLDTLKALGIGASEATAFVLGFKDSLGDLTAAADDDAALLRVRNELMAKFGIDQDRATKLINDARDATLGQRKANELQNQSLEDQQALLLEVTKGMLEGTTSVEDQTKALLEQAKTALPQNRQQVLDLIAAINGIPPERIAEIKADADPNDLAQVEAELDRLARDRTATINADLVMSRNVAAFVKAGGVLQPLGSGPQTFQTNVVVNAGFGTDAFAVQQAVLQAVTQVNRLQQGAARTATRRVRRV